MRKDKKLLTKELKKAMANDWQKRAAFILLNINGINNAIEYVKGLRIVGNDGRHGRETL